MVWCIPFVLLSNLNLVNFFLKKEDVFSYLDTLLETTNPVIVSISLMIIIIVGLILFLVLMLVLFRRGDDKENKYGLQPINIHYLLSHLFITSIPTGKATNLEIIYTSPEKKYSIAKMNWNGLENSYAIRWNFGLNSWFIIPQKLAMYIDFTRFLNEKELYTLISDKIIMAVKKQKEINPSLFSLSISYNSKKIDSMIIEEIKKILAVEKVTLISFSENIENTIFNVAYT